MVKHCWSLCKRGFLCLCLGTLSNDPKIKMLCALCSNLLLHPCSWAEFGRALATTDVALCRPSRLRGSESAHQWCIACINLMFASIGCGSQLQLLCCVTLTLYQSGTLGIVALGLNPPPSWAQRTKMATCIRAGHHKRS